MKRAEERADRAAVFLSGPGEREFVGALSLDRMRIRCRPGFVRNLAEPVLLARLSRRPEGGTDVVVRVGMRKLAFGFMTMWVVGAGLAALGVPRTGRPVGLGVALAGAALFSGCVLLERPMVRRLLRLSDDLFAGD